MDVIEKYDFAIDQNRKSINILYMNEYMFYTFEGFTQSPKGIDVENLQILGFEKGSSPDKALKNLLINNSSIRESCFNIEHILFKQIFTRSIKKEVIKVIDYLWKDEERHYQESLPDVDNHIFESIKKLKKSL